MKILAETSESPLFTSAQIVLIFLAFVATILLISFIKKMYYRFRKHKRYYIFPRLGVKGITNIAMTISLSIAIIMLLTVITSGLLGILFRAYPGWRVTIEGLLIQLGGLLFGPIIGLFIGGLTDLLSIALTAGMFHYGYFIGALAYGLFSGLIKTMINWFKNNMVYFSIVSTLISGLVFAMFALFVNFQNYENFKISLFAKDIIFTKAALISYTAVIFGAVNLVVWILLPFYNYNKMLVLVKRCKYNLRYGLKFYYYKRKLVCAKDKTKVSMAQCKWYAKNMKNIMGLRQSIFNIQNGINTKNLVTWFDYLCPVLFLCLSGEFIISTMMLPFFDLDFSAYGYDYWLALRTCIFPIIFFVNLALIFPAYRVVANLVNYNYQSDMVESINRPFMNS